ncbi:MAG: hypothetical protein R3175_03630 [Marinobacter sp.]|uniref:hypothetical protein n=1 Tax=Marinobacter sp. TaxID=50741 RepID=UPI00299DE4B3|nr:hypothetical protein [Marinobacter sp.]MDX1755129.1 hypothetical protein [Marinobacter sp.]
MTSMPAERSWLLDPSRLKLVHQCRRLIHTEFGVKLHLTDDALTEKLADFAGRSRSSQLQRTWSQLKEAIPGYQSPPATEEPTRRVYRGQVVAEESNKESASSRSGEEAAAPKRQVIYRGQVVG